MDAATEPVADPAADRRIGKILRRHRLRRRTVGRAIGRGPGAVLSAGVVGALVLSGCASQDPGVPEPAAQTQPITVGADLADAQQAVLGEIYVGAMERRGRGAEAVIDVPSEERMQAVQSGGVTLSFGCTGELLGLIDPVTARELADEYIADDDPGKALSPEWRDRVYAAVSSALPGEIMATDPSNAQGCGREDGLSDAEAAALEASVADDPGAVLPQHIVPFYLKPAMTRSDRVNVLNRVAGSMSTEELDRLTEDVEDGADAAETARDWLDTSRFATG